MELRLPGRPEAVRAARHALDRFRDELDEQSLENLRLLVSEVVTNSIRHGASGRTGGEVVVRLDTLPDVVRVEVVDEGDGFDPEIREPNAAQTSGWGLFLVDQLASRWGVTVDGATNVWFELERGRTSDRSAGSGEAADGGSMTFR